MSAAAIEAVRRFLEALWDRRDVDAALANADDELELDWTESRGPYAGVHRGKPQVKRWWEQVSEAWADFRVDRREFIGARGDDVVVEQVVCGRGRSSGIEIRATGATVWTVRDGKVLRGKLFQSRDDALAATGEG